MVAKHKQTSSFKYGFSIKGFGANEVGTDLIATYKSLEAWEGDNEKEVGTPIQIDTSKDRTLKICPDGEVPHGFLEVRVGKKLSDYEMMLNLYPVSEVRPGNPVTFVKYVEYAILETSLFVEGYTPAVGNSIYVEDGLFSNSDEVVTELTGTVEVEEGSLTTVVGTETEFESELAVGDTIRIDDEDRVVSAIASDTSLTVSAAFDGAIAAEEEIYKVKESKPIGEVIEVGKETGFAEILLYKG